MKTLNFIQSASEYIKNGDIHALVDFTVHSVIENNDIARYGQVQDVIKKYSLLFRASGMEDVSDEVIDLLGTSLYFASDIISPANIKKEEFDERAFLSEVINLLAMMYYNGNEIIPDDQYDILIAKLKAIDPSNPIASNGLAAADNTGRTKYKHFLITGTQAKCKDMSEFTDWIKGKSGIYNISAKIDGAGVEIQYKDGKIFRAISRGDGFEGEDITNSAIKWNNMVHVIPGFTGSIRGEFLLKESIFKKKYADVMKNARNASAGIAKRLDGEGSDDMSFIAYDRLTYSENFRTEEEKMRWLDTVGFETPKWISTGEIKDIEAFRTKIDTLRHNEIDYNCDGIVVKQNVIDYSDLKRHTPKTQCAVKFSLETAVSKILDIEWGISGSYLSPVAILEPIELNGTTVSRASLSNINKMMKKGVVIGKTAKIKKGGEIIPVVEEILN